MKDLIIIGAGGHGKVVADIARRCGNYRQIAFLDDGDATECLRLPIVGKVADALRYVASADVFVAIGNSRVRSELLERLLSVGATVPTLIHPNAVVGEDVLLGAGTVVMAGAIVNPCTVVGKGVILNTCSSVDHDCTVGDYAHVSVGAHVAGSVNVGAHAWLGVGSVVKNNISICDGVMVGAGAVVVKDITEKGTYVGVPAKRIKSNG